MSDDTTGRDGAAPAGAQAGATSPAERALAEAAARRAAQEAVERTPAEHGGRGGPDPVRYGDWEIKGRAIDF